MKKHYQYASVLRAAACMAIVVFHAFLLTAQNGSSFAYVTISFAVRKALMWAVPCFVMVTGMLLLDRRHDVTIRKIYGKYLRRILLALIIFTFVFALFDAVAAGQVGFFVFRTWLVNLLTGTGWEHMWYLYMLTGLYVLLPVYRKVAADASPVLIRYLLTVYAVFLSVIPLITTATGTTSGFYIPVSTIYPFYLFLGYALAQEDIRFGKKAAALSFILSTAAVIVLTVVAIRFRVDKMTALLNNYGFLLHIVQAAGLFQWFRLSLDGNGQKEEGSDERKEKTAVRKRLPFLMAVDRCSFGIYLLHMLFLKLLFQVVNVSTSGAGGIGVILLGAVFSFFAAFAVTAVLHRARIPL